jgi:hypothetical protein
MLEDLLESRVNTLDPAGFASLPYCRGTSVRGNICGQCCLAVDLRCYVHEAIMLRLSTDLFGWSYQLNDVGRPMHVLKCSKGISSGMDRLSDCAISVSLCQFDAHRMIRGECL